MTTDFNYNNKTIDSSGPIKPSGTDQPGDPRTRVDFYSDIKLIPNPYVGMIITVKMDETNQNKMTDYKVISLKPNALGIANSVIDQVQRYVDYLGATTGGTGLTSEQEAKLNSIDNKVDKIDGKGLSTEDFTTEEKITLANLKTTVGDKRGLPSGDANVIASINRIDRKTTTGNGLTTEQEQQLQTAYEHSQSDHVTMDEVNAAISNAQLGGGEVDTRLELIMPSESINLVAGTPSTFTFQLPEYVRCAYKITDNCGYITLSGNTYLHGGFQFWTSGETSKSMTFTADSSITTNIIDYIYFAPYGNADAKIVKTCKLKTYISANSSAETYGNIIVSSTNLTVPENGRTTFTVSLDAAPSTTQNVNISVSDSNASVDLTTLIFTSDNYNRPQTVTVTGGHIADSYQDLSTVINVTSGTSTKAISVTVTNIDEAPSAPVIVTNVSSLSVNEGSDSTFTVSLDKTPTNNAVITLSSTNGNCSLSPSTLTFTSDNYNKPQTVTVTGIQDSNSYSNKTDTVTLISSINDIASKSVNVTIINIDERPVITEPATANLIFHSDGRDVEAGSTQAYWNNKIAEKSVAQINITAQFGTPNSSWNDMTKSYGWLGDSFRYYLTNTKQTSVTFDEITDNYTICVGFVQEDTSEKFYHDNQRKIWCNQNNLKTSGNVHSLYMIGEKKGKLTPAFGTNGSTNILDTKLDVDAPSQPTLMHYYTSVDFTNNTVKALANGNLLTTATINGNITNPRNIFTLAIGSYTSPVRIYYVRVYNKALTNEEMIELYNIENTIERSVG